MQSLAADNWSRSSTLSLSLCAFDGNPAVLHSMPLVQFQTSSNTGIRSRGNREIRGTEGKSIGFLHTCLQLCSNAMLVLHISFYLVETVYEQIKPTFSCSRRGFQKRYRVQTWSSHDIFGSKDTKTFKTPLWIHIEVDESELLQKHTLQVHLIRIKLAQR